MSPEFVLAAHWASLWGWGARSCEAWSGHEKDLRPRVSDRSLSIYVAVYLFIICPFVELFILIVEPSQEPLSRAQRGCEAIFICVSDFKSIPPLLGKINTS